MRALTFTNKKLRGKRRLFRWLTGWARSFSEYFPSRETLAGYSYWNWKIPVPFSLVEGRRRRKKSAIHCAQLLLGATANLAASRPDWAKDFRMTCCIQTPDMFGSEVCIYLDEEYFQHQTGPARGEYETKERITGKSLARRWNLEVPQGFQELGLRVFIPDPEDGDYRNEWWFYGELD